MLEEFYYNLLKRERRVDKTNGRGKIRRMKLVHRVNNRNEQADTYPKIDREGKHEMAETLSKRARKRQRISWSLIPTLDVIIKN